MIHILPPLTAFSADGNGVSSSGWLHAVLLAAKLLLGDCPCTPAFESLRSVVKLGLHFGILLRPAVHFETVGPGLVSDTSIALGPRLGKSRDTASYFFLERIHVGVDATHDGPRACPVAEHRPGPGPGDAITFATSSFGID